MRMSTARFKIPAAARRTGKTKDFEGYILFGHGPIVDGQPKFRGAFCPPTDIVDPTFVIAAPTREMVKRIWWANLKRRVPSQWVAAINETELTITLVNGARVMCMGMDRPTRGEGFAIDGLVGDEFAYWKPMAFEQSLRPALSTRGRPGWAILGGKPAGRNHFYRLWSEAKSGLRKGYEAFHWTAAAVMDPAELEAARAELDPRSFEQEYEASFLTQTGRVCYRWDESVNVRPLQYNPSLPLVVCFDFNVSPGAAVVLQEQSLPPRDAPDAANDRYIATTCILDEYYRQDDSNTPLACAWIRDNYGHHKGPVHVYGDVGGHQRRTSAKSTDWEIVEEELAKSFADVRIYVGRSAPDIVDSVNALNTRMRASDGTVRLALDARKARQTKLDLESVVWDEKKADRAIDKGDKERTHWFDALRYYIAEEHPIGGSRGFTEY